MGRRRSIPIFRHPRTGIWHLRRTIPTRLQRYFVQANGNPRRELSPLSLGTRDEKQAERLAVRSWGEHLSTLDTLARGRPNVGGAKRFFHDLFEREEVQSDAESGRRRDADILDLADKVETLELNVATSSDPTKQMIARRRLRVAQAKLLQLRNERSRYRDHAKAALSDISSPEIADVVMDEYVNQFVAEHPQPVDDTPLGRQVRGELREIAREEAAAALAKSVALAGGSTALSPHLPAAHANATDHTPSLTVLEYYREVFRPGRGLKTKRGQTGLSPSGMERCMEGARDFTDVMGDMRLSSVTPAHVREFMNTMLQVPRQWRKRTANAGKSLRTLAAEADAATTPVDRLSPVTVNSTLTGLRQIFAYAVKNDHVQSNPTNGIAAETAKDRDIDPAFEIEDLNKLFASPWFAGCRSDSDVRRPGDHLIRDHRYWPFLCMLFSGARVAEIGGIHAKQVHILPDMDEGFFEFDWTEGEYGRRIKNASSVRVVPIHQELIRLGFIDYVRKIKAAEHERLFPGWEPQRRMIDEGIFKNEYSSSPFLKRFKTYLVWLGIKRPGLSVKSLRATWETATLGTDVNERTLLKIAGRAQGGALANYLPMKAKWEQLKPTVDQIAFPGLKIDHLCPSPAKRETPPPAPAQAATASP